MGIPAIDRAITIAQQFLRQSVPKKDEVHVAAIPLVVLPPVEPSEWVDDYVARVAKQVSPEQFLTPDELNYCQKMKPAYDLWSGRQIKFQKIGALVGAAVVGISAYVNPDSLFSPFFLQWFPKEQIAKIFEFGVFEEPVMKLLSVTANVSVNMFIGLVAAVKIFDSVNGHIPSRVIKNYTEKCIDVPAERMQEAAEAEYEKATHVSVFSADAVATKRPFAWAPSASDAESAAKKFADTAVATAAYDVKVVGEVAEKAAVPLVILGLAAFGAAKMIRTGDSSVVQRAWAMVR